MSDKNIWIIVIAIFLIAIAIKFWPGGEPPDKLNNTSVKLWEQRGPEPTPDEVRAIILNISGGQVTFFDGRKVYKITTQDKTLQNYDIGDSLCLQSNGLLIMWRD